MYMATTTKPVLMKDDTTCAAKSCGMCSLHQELIRWCLTADGCYSSASASAYGAMFLGSSRPLGAKEIWKTSALPKVGFFF